MKISFFSNFQISRRFFFLDCVVFFFRFFFSGKVYSGLTNSLSNSCFFCLKKTGFLLTNSDFHEKCTKLNYSRKKKTGPLSGVYDCASRQKIENIAGSSSIF